jgi:dipeptidyl aminopeptidase/acylaminoacyl peptidase
MLGSGSVAVFPETEDGATVIDLDGKAQSASVPPYRYLGWLPSPDGTSVAVAEADEAEDGTGADRLILWDRASGERRTIPVDLQSVDIGEPPSFLVPLAFDTAKKNLYLQARQSLDDDFAGFALLRIDLDAGSSEVLLTQSEEETSPRRLVSIAPDLDFALFERQSPDSADDTERAPDLDIEAFSLADRAFSLWFSQAGVQAPAIPATSPLSPDGRFLALESSDLEHPGVLFWDAKEKKLIRMTESGGFLGWTPDGQNMLVEEILQNEGEETSQYQVQSIDRESRELTTVFRYNDVSEGGGMNAKGDTFFQLIGISS